MSFGVAYGLALQGLKQARLQTNLLPYEVRLERLSRGKKPWAVAAAAVLAFGMFLMALAAGAEKSAVDNKSVMDAKNEAEAEKKRVLQFTADSTEEQKKLKAAQDRLTTIGAGVKERMNWQLLHQFVNMVTPQADGGHLAELSAANVPVKKQYWTDKKEAQKAFKDFEDKKYNTGPKLTQEESQKRDQFIKEYLIQLNIVGVNAMYSDDLSGYFKKLYEDGKELLGMTQAEKDRIEKLIKGSDKDTPKTGWVVEIRGYTYHWDGDKFIENTLIQNLRSPGDLKDITIDEDFRKKASERVSFLHNYKTVTFKNPQPGVFNIIQNSQLPALLAGGAAPAQGGAAGGWAPIGDTAVAVFTGAAPPPIAPLPGAVESKEKRTEFVVLFLWEEPIVTPLTAAPPVCRRASAATARAAAAWRQEMI